MSRKFTTKQLMAATNVDIAAARGLIAYLLGRKQIRLVGTVKSEGQKGAGENLYESVQPTIRDPVFGDLDWIAGDSDLPPAA